MARVFEKQMAGIQMRYRWQFFKMFQEQPETERILGALDRMAKQGACEHSDTTEGRAREILVMVLQSLEGNDAELTVIKTP